MLPNDDLNASEIAGSDCWRFAHRVSSRERNVLRTLNGAAAIAGHDPVDLLDQTFPLLGCRMVVGGLMVVSFHTVRETFEHRLGMG